MRSSVLGGPRPLLFITMLVGRVDHVAKFGAVLLRYIV